MWLNPSALSGPPPMPSALPEWHAKQFDLPVYVSDIVALARACEPTNLTPVSTPGIFELVQARSKKEVIAADIVLGEQGAHAVVHGDDLRKLLPTSGLARSWTPRTESDCVGWADIGTTDTDNATI